MSDKVSLATLALAKAYTDAHGGGSGTDNYNDLTHLPTVNGVEFKGTMTGETIGLVDAESGKGLSTNDYTDADKTIVGGVTSALAGKADASTVNAILDGQSIDSFGDVETALDNKTDLDVIDTEFSSHNMYAEGEYTVYNGELYVFTAQHEGEWTGTDVTKRTVATALQYKADYSTVDAILDGQSIDSFADVESALADKVSWDDNAVIGAKNLLPFKYMGMKSNNGVTYTAAKDGTVTCSGTASDTSLWRVTTVIPKGSYKLYGGENIATKAGTGNNVFVGFWNNANPGNYISPDANGVYTFANDTTVGMTLRIGTGIDSSSYTFKPMLLMVDDTDTTYQEPTLTNKGLTEEKFSWDANADYGVHNINRTVYKPTVKNGVTWSFIDGVLDAYASSPSTGESRPDSTGFISPFSGQMILTGCNSGDSGIHIYPWDLTDDARPYADSSKTTRITTDNIYYGNSITFYMIKGHKYIVYCRIAQGKTPNHVKFYPMIRKAEDSCTTYTYPALTNKELTDSKVDWETNAKLGAKNLLPFATYKEAGSVIIVDNLDITFDTINGTLTLNGSTSESDSVDVLTFYLGAGNYILNGIPSGMTGAKLKLINVTDSNTTIGYDEGNGLAFTLSAGKSVKLKLDVTANSSFSNATVSPMIRYAADADDTFAPYVYTNKVITEIFSGLFGRNVYKSTDTGRTDITVTADGFTDITVPDITGYKILTKNVEITGTGSSAYSYVSGAGANNIVKVVNRGAQSYTWGYSIEVYYISEKFIDSVLYV